MHSIHRWSLLLIFLAASSAGGEESPSSGGIESNQRGRNVTLPAEVISPQGSAPKLVFNPDGLVSSRSQQVGERTITIQKVAPLELPSVRLAAVTNPSLSFGTTDGEGIDSASKTSRTLFLGVTTYIPAEVAEQPRSLIQYWPPGRVEPVLFWVNANFLWMTGFADFESADTRYSLIMAISREDLGSIASLPGGSLPVPEFEGSAATFKLAKGMPEPEDTVAMQALVDFYNGNQLRLKEAYEGRVAETYQRLEQERLHPAAKKNMVLKYWRLDEAGQTQGPSAAK